MAEAIIVHTNNGILVTDKRAGALVSRLHADAANAGVDLHIRSVKLPALSHGYKNLFRSTRNAGTFSYKTDYGWYHAEKQNTLFIEHSVIDQSFGYFFDSAGLFSDSTLSRSRWRPVAEFDVESLVMTRFGWEAWSGGDCNGPVLVCLQRPKDCSVKPRYFPHTEDGVDVRVTLLKLLAEHSADSLLVRVHPKDGEFNPPIWRDNWRLDRSGEEFNTIVKRCRAVVTISSTCASEAVLLGMPVATFGTGVFTGHNITLDCSSDPSLVAHLPDWRPDVSRCRAYVSRVLERHLMSFEGPYRYPCAEFSEWLTRCK